ncbi:hypothetical protein FWH58_02100 [Candidatus Saccharibacteria bacterium]|nr:hypothetical protein [Candidatus Saccharibacteria bacterium]
MKKGLILCGLFAAFCVVLLTGLSVSAFTITNQTGGRTIVGCSLKSATDVERVYCQPPNSYTIVDNVNGVNESINVAKVFIDLDSAVPSHSVISFTLSVQPTGSGTNRAQALPYYGFSGNGNETLLNSSLSRSGGTLTIYLQYYINNSASRIWLTPSGSTARSVFFANDLVTGTNVIWRWSNVSYVVTDGGVTSADLSAISSQLQQNNNLLQNIQNSNDSISFKITDTNNLLTQILVSAQDQVNATDRQTDQQAEDAQKQRDREDSEKDNVQNVADNNKTNNLAGTDVGGLFSIFGSASCSNNPTVQRWLHLKSGQFCPAFSSEIRGIGSAIITIVISLIVLRYMLNKEANNG